MRRGLRARYLRVRALETVGGSRGALRVAVSRTLAPHAKHTSSGRPVRAAQGQPTAGDATDSGVIAYTLTIGQLAGVGRENRNTRYARDRNAPSKSGGMCRYD
eukprot:1607643-Rhodomonas_salina.1